MLMVIFGAGASYDSCPTYPPIQGPDVEVIRPPLANNLFDNREIFVKTLDEFPQCKPIVPRLRDPVVQLGKISIEKRLEEIREEARTYPRGVRELTAVRCYLQRAVRICEIQWAGKTKGVTNQLTLLREIERTSTNDEPVCLVTFNYDTLLEAALESLGTGHKIGAMRDYTSDDRLFRLFKLHGSVNWGLEFNSPPPSSLSLPSQSAVGRFVVDETPKLRVPEIYVFSEALSLLSNDRRPVFPAIAIPVENKTDFQCPKLMLDALKQLLPDVSRVITIGWRASEAHFLDLMAMHLRPGVGTYVVAGTPKEAEEVRTSIMRAMSGAPPSCRAENVKGFTEFMLSGSATPILTTKGPGSG
jgi:hypothetical protein